MYLDPSYDRDLLGVRLNYDMTRQVFNMTMTMTRQVFDMTQPEITKAIVTSQLTLVLQVER